MRPLAENPLVALLEARARRARRPVAAAWWLALGLPALLGAGLPLGWRLVALVVVASAWPLHVACSGASLLASLRRGRGLEEVLNSPTTPAELVDGLARHSAAAAGSGWWWLGTLWILWGVGFAGLSPEAALVLVVPGVLLQIALAFLGSYLAQAGYAWSDGEGDLLLRHLLLLPAVLLAAWEPLPGVLVLALYARWLAMRGLDGYGRLHARMGRLWRRLATGRGSLRRAARGLRNAIVYREARAEVGRAPGGLPGLLLARHAVAAILVGGILAAAHVALSHHWRGLPQILWGGLATLFLVQTMRAAYLAAGSLLDEREGGTLEPLLGTALSASEFVDGWARVAALPRTVENLAAGFVLVVLASVAGLPPERMGMCAWLLATFTIASAYAGVAVSAGSESRQAVVDRTGVTLAGGVWLIGMLGLLVAFQGRQEYVPVAAGLGLAAVVAARGRALALLTGGTPVEATPGTLERALPGPLQRGLARRRVAARLRQELPGRAPADFQERLLARLEARGLVKEDL